MSIRNAIIGWSERGAITDVRAALDMAGVLPHAQHWRAFLDRLLLWSGAVALAAAVVFFIAHNWNDLGKLAKFGLLEALVLAAALGYWRLGPGKAAGKASLLVAWELAARRIRWLDERWAPRLLAIAGGTSITALALHAILDWRDASGMAFLVYPVWLGCAYAAYRRFMPDLFVLAGGCLSVIVVVTTFLAKHLLQARAEAVAFLFIAMNKNA